MRLKEICNNRECTSQEVDKINTLAEILANLDANAPMSIDDIVRMEVADWENDPRKKLMQVGEQYYLTHNAILERERKTIDENGRTIKARNLADNRISHGFMRKLVDQKTDYLLAKPFMVETDNKAYQEELDNIFDMELRKKIKHVGTDSINSGIGWMHIYYNEEGNLSFKRIPSQECIPIWKDAEHSELAAMIRVYERVEYVAKIKKTIKCAELWNENGVRFYDTSKSGILDFVEARDMFSVKVVEKDKVIESGVNWDRVPFQWFKYNLYEQPLIDIIKRLIDDYDNQKSDNSNNLEDLPNGIFVVSDFSGTEAGEFRKNISQYRVAFTREGGDVKTISLTMNNEGYAKHIEQTRKDIYEFGRGVDTQSTSLGNSPSGIALRFLYSDLDMDVNSLESEFQTSLQRLLWFVDKHIQNTTGADYSNEKVTFIFNRDIAINETEAVENVAKSVGILSEETNIANHPWTTNTPEEMKRKAKEDKQKFTDYPDLNESTDGEEE